MKTQRFINLEEKFTQLELAFEKNPNKKTATDLAKIRAEISSLPKEEKYTKEYLQKEEYSFLSRISDLLVDSVLADKI